MDNLTSIKAVEISVVPSVQGDWQLRKPCYGSYCFAHLPDTILSLLGAEPRGSGTLPDDCLPTSGSFRHVVLLFVDSFGWDALQRYTSSEHAISPLIKIRDNSICSKITTQFPSTTSGHVSCIHSGIPVYESGVYEWFYYSKRADQIVSPLIFSGISPYEANSLLKQGLQPADIFAAPDFYPRLRMAGVTPHVFQARPYIESPYNYFILDQAETHPFLDYRKGLSEMVEVIGKQKGRSYSFFYHDSYDHVCHANGPISAAGDRVAEEIYSNILALLLEPIKGRSDVLVLITADHGQSPMNPRETLYLDDHYPELESLICKNSKGEPIVPAGSPRDLFLHIEQEHLAAAKEKISDLCGDKAVVLTREELINHGFFGPVESIGEELLDNLGSLVVLPRPGESVYWRGGGKFESSFLGHHGGVSTSEMDSMLLAYVP